MAGARPSEAVIESISKGPFSLKVGSLKNVQPITLPLTQRLWEGL